MVRTVVAERGYKLNLALFDESYSVRKEVAKQGYGLDWLVINMNK